MNGLSLSTAVFAALLASSAIAADEPMTQENDTQAMEQRDQQQNDSAATMEDDEAAGNDGMKGMESQAEQKRRELEEKADHDLLPDTGTDADYEGETDTDELTN